MVTYPNVTNGRRIRNDYHWLFYVMHTFLTTYGITKHHKRSGPKEVKNAKSANRQLQVIWYEQGKEATAQWSPEWTEMLHKKYAHKDGRKYVPNLENFRDMTAFVAYYHSGTHVAKKMINILEAIDQLERNELATKTIMSHNLADHLQKLYIMSDQTPGLNHDVPQFKLPAWYTGITFIDSDNQLDGLYHTLCICAEKSSPIGIDTETCMLLSDGASSIIQISTPSHGYIIDSFQMSDNPRLAALILWILQHAHLRKYVYAFGNDLRALRRNFPHGPRH